MIIKNKQGLSPLITTIFLILLAIILAVIILLWATGFTGEKISKFIPSSGGDRPITEACEKVLLQVSITGTNELSIINQGDIPLYKLGVRVTDSASGESTVKEYDVVKGLSTGQSISIQSTQTLSGNKVSIVPILIGKSDKSDTKEYNCKNWVEVV
jgi:FlaG/FlaF family flagellin (archaellin)